MRHDYRAEYRNALTWRVFGGLIFFVALISIGLMWLWLIETGPSIAAAGGEWCGLDVAGQFLAVVLVGGLWTHFGYCWDADMRKWAALRDGRLVNMRVRRPIPA